MLCCVIAASTAIGVLLAEDKKRRACVFRELYEFNGRMLLNLKYKKLRISQITGEGKYIPKIVSGKRVLGGDDGQFISDYFSGFGVSDAQSQIDYLNERTSLLKKKMDESFADYKKYSALYIKIALMTGILIAVLLA